LSVTENSYNYISEVLDDNRMTKSCWIWSTV